MRRTRVAIIGARGIGNYGGFETVVGELAPRLVARGFDVACSNELTRNLGIETEYRGVKRMYFPFVIPKSYSARKIMELVYDWYFAIRCSVFEHYDLVYCLGAGAGPSLFLARLSSAKIAVNIDGVEWKRTKFGPLEKCLIKLLYFTCYACSDHLVFDNKRLENMIPAQYRHKSVYVPNGVTLPISEKWNAARLEECIHMSNVDIRPDDYLLVVSRLEPENNIYTIVDGYARSRVSRPLVIVGNFTSEKYRKKITEILSELPSDKNVVLTGAIHQPQVLDMLRSHCRAYIHGHSVGGTNPSLLEAMAARNLIIAHDNPFNREVCTDSALYFKDAETLGERLYLTQEKMDQYRDFGENAYDRARDHFNWEDIVEKCVALFYDWTAAARSAHPRRE